MVQTIYKIQMQRKIKISPLTCFFSVISSYSKCDLKVSRHDGGLSMKMGTSQLLLLEYYLKLLWKQRTSLLPTN